MASDDGGDYVGSDDDDEFNQDLEALRRACLLTGTNPCDFQKQTHSAAADARAVAVDSGSKSDDSNDDDGGNEDLELVRNIQERFAIVTDKRETLLKPLYSILPGPADKEDDFEDDFETLRAIQRRFAAYGGDAQKDNLENFPHQLEHAGNLPHGTSDNLFVESSNAAAEDHSSMGKINNILNDGSCPKLTTRSETLDLWRDCSSVDATRLPIKGSLFPKGAEAFVDAIKKNRSCQKLMRSKLLHIESRIEELKQLKERVKILKDFQVSCRRRTGRALSQKRDARTQLISMSKKSQGLKLNEKKPSPMQYGPAENSQVAKFREAVEKSPALMGRPKWAKEEDEKLAKGLRQQFQEMLLQSSLDLLSDGERLDENFGTLDGIVASIGSVDIPPEKMRLFLPKVNWDYLASMHVPGRSGAECQSRWLNCGDPLINQNPWTSMEDKILLHVVQQKGLSNWIDIATSVGTNRTPFQCLARFQRSLNASIIKREWTEEEDDQLRAAVEAFGESNWQIVASAMEGRTGTQCSNRWMKSLHPARQKVGRWTGDEDKRLKVAVMLFGPKIWKKIAEFVPGRTQVQCRERWVNSLDPSLNLDTWTAEEDSKLKEAIEHHGFCWSKVAACVPPRTDSQCRRRWKVLLPDQVPLLRAARETQKAALISNFVDRESERPALRPDDFVPSQQIISLSECETVGLPRKQNRRLRRRRVNAPSSQCSGDACSEKVPVLPNGTEGETLTNNSSSKNRRRRGHSKKTKSGWSPEEHLSCCPGSMEPLAANNNVVPETSGAAHCCLDRDFHNPETVSRDMLIYKGTAAVSGITSEERYWESPCKKLDDGFEQAVSNLSSLDDLNSSLVTGGRGIHNLRDEDFGTYDKQAYGICPYSKSWSYGEEEDGGGSNTAQPHSFLPDTTPLTMANLKAISEVDINFGAETTWQAAEVAGLLEWKGSQHKKPGTSSSDVAVSNDKDTILVPQKPKQKRKPTRRRMTTDVGDSRTKKGTRKRARIPARDVVDDDSTLAAFCKKRSAAGDTGDDDDDDEMTLASFCSKLKRKKVE